LKFLGAEVGDCILIRTDPIPALSFSAIALRSLTARNLRDFIFIGNNTQRKKISLIRNKL